MRVVSTEHAAEIQIAWLYRQQTEMVNRHARVLLTAGIGAANLASEYLKELARRETTESKEAVAA